MQDIEYFDKPLPLNDQKSMIDSEMAQWSNIPSITTTSPPSPPGPPKEKEHSQATVPTPVPETTTMAHPSEPAPSYSTPISSATTSSTGAVLPEHAFGEPEILESEIREANAEEEYLVEEEEDELLSQNGDGEQDDGNGTSK